MSGAAIQIYGWTPTEFENMALGKIEARLGHERKDILKTFKVGSLCCTTAEEQILHREEIQRCYEVNGFMALGENTKGRGFRFLIEKGLPWDHACDLADQLATQVCRCADRMLADRKAGRRQEDLHVIGA